MTLTAIETPVGDIIRAATAMAVHKTSERTQVIHLLVGALLYSDRNQAFLAQRCRVGQLTHLENWRKRINESLLLLEECTPEPSAELFNLFNRFVTEGRSKQLLTERALMQHILRDPDTRIDRYLRTLKVDRQDLLSLWSQEETADGVVDPKSSGFSDYLENMNEKFRRGEIHPIQGRQADMEWLINTLCQYRKKSAILIGQPGVGKTALIEELALRIEQGRVPEQLKGKQVWSLDVGGMVAGTKLRGEFEERLRNLIRYLKQNPNSLLFVDEIHTIMSAGNVRGSSLNASNMLKPALSRGEIVCIGATTPDDVQPLEKDPAFKRRFQFRWLTDLSNEETLEVLKAEAVRLSKHYGITYSIGGIKRVLDAANEYFPHQFNPDKSLTLLDSVGSFIRNKMGQTVVNTKAVNASLRDKDFRDSSCIISDIERQLRGMFPAETVNAISTTVSGYLLHLRQPGILTLSGQEWVVREVVSILSQELHRQAPICIDGEEMTGPDSLLQLKGSPPSYIKEPTLLEDLRYAPHRVVFVRNLDKSLPEFQRALSRAIVTGDLLESSGRRLQTRHALFIVSTDAAKPSIGFNGEGDSTPKLPAEMLKLAGKAHLPQPSAEWVRGYLRGKLKTLSDRVKSKIKVAFTEEALEQLRLRMERTSEAEALQFVENEILQANTRQVKRLVITDTSVAK